MDKELEKCIERRKIIKFSKARTLTGKELKLALEDLKCAKESFLNKNYRWTTIQSYYSMFHSARALLYKKGYREKSHFCLIEAVREFYVMGGKLNFKFIEALMLGKSLRENADYYGDFDEHSSNEMMEMAGKFFKEAKRILQEN
ncbi:MAG: HEPN domain-containing protein [bacterium]